MNAEIITIGNELLNGTTINTNASWISDKLWRMGIVTKRVLTISDEALSIKKALADSLSRVDIILITGGLGPTNDDVTKKSIADYFNVPLEENKTLRERIEFLFANRGVPMPKINLEQALIPQTSKIIPNEIGTAAGFYFEQNNKICLIMPGVPAEMKKMVQEFILPLLLKKYSDQLGHVMYRMLRTTGIYESKLHEVLSPVIKDLHDVSIASLPHRYGVDLRLGIYKKTKQDAELHIQKAQDLILLKISSFVYEVGDRDLAQVAAELLLKNKLSVAVAESCTGGLIQNFFTNIPGSSNFLLGGVVAYENALKKNILGVKKETIEMFGAVSAETAQEMVKGVQQLTNSDCAISTTGIAGPTGGTVEKPVGLVFIGCLVKNEIEVQKFIFHKERMINKYRFAYAALNMLRQKLISLL